MGCDIHVIAEVKVNNTWRPFNLDIDVLRNYELFGILAGVREPNLQFFQRKGLPEEYQDLPKFLLPGKGEGHSFSWLTLAELQTYDWRNSHYYDFYENVIHYLKSYLEDLTMWYTAVKREPADLRIVFGFDN